MAMFEECGGGFALAPIFEPQVQWNTFPNGAVVSRSAGYEIEVYRDDRLSRLIRLDREPRIATEELAEQEVGEVTLNFGRGPCAVSPGDMVEKRGFAEQIPWISDVVSVPSGELWVQRNAIGRDAPRSKDVFDSRGVYVGTLPETAPDPILFLDEDRLAAAETDEFDVTRLVVYRVNRTPDT